MRHLDWFFSPARLWAAFCLMALLVGCGQEAPDRRTPSPPPPAAQVPPQEAPPVQESPSPVTEEVLKVIKDRSGRHTAQVVRRGDKKVVLQDGRAGPEYDDIGEVAFSADGLTLAYEARRGDARLLVLDGREWPLDTAIVPGSLRVSPDNQRLAMVGRARGHWQVMVDSRPDPPFDYVFIDTLTFSRDSQTFGYLALKGEALMVVVDGKVVRRLDILAAGKQALEKILKREGNQPAGVPGKDQE